MEDQDWQKEADGKVNEIFYSDSKYGSLFRINQEKLLFLSYFKLLLWIP